MKAEQIEYITKTAALEAVKEFQKSEQKNKKVKIFQNTKKLMENYNRMCKSVEEGIAELSDIPSGDGEEYVEEDIFIQSILKSKLRSLVMLAHVDKCLRLLEAEMYRKNTPEKYMAFTYYYLDEMRQENIGEVLNCADRTVRRWITELTNILSVYLFGSDAIMLD